MRVVGFCPQDMRRQGQGKYFEDKEIGREIEGNGELGVRK